MVKQTMKRYFKIVEVEYKPDQLESGNCYNCLHHARQRLKELALNPIPELLYSELYKCPDCGYSILFHKTPEGNTYFSTELK